MKKTFLITLISGMLLTVALPTLAAKSITLRINVKSFAFNHFTNKTDILTLFCDGKNIITIMGQTSGAGIGSGALNDILGKWGTYKCYFDYTAHLLDGSPVELSRIAEFILSNHQDGLEIIDFYASGKGTHRNKYYYYAQTENQPTWKPHTFTLTYDPANINLNDSSANRS